jgi:hypothetical protein
MPPPRLAILEGMEPRPKRRLIGFIETTDQQFDRRRNINGTDRATAFRAERAARHLRRAEGRGRAARSIPVDIAAWKLDPCRRQRAGMLLALPAGACMRIVGRPDRLIANPAAEAPAAIDNFCHRLLPVFIRYPRSRLRNGPRPRPIQMPILYTALEQTAAGHPPTARLTPPCYRYQIRRNNSQEASRGVIA